MDIELADSINSYIHVKNIYHPSIMRDDILVSLNWGNKKEIYNGGQMT